MKTVEENGKLYFISESGRRYGVNARVEYTAWLDFPVLNMDGETGESTDYVSQDDIEPSGYVEYWLYEEVPINEDGLQGFRQEWLYEPSEFLTMEWAEKQIEKYEKGENNA